MIWKFIVSRLSRGATFLRWRVAFDVHKHLGVPLRTHRLAESAALENTRAAIDLLEELEPGKASVIGRYIRNGIAIEITDYANGWFDVHRGICFLGGNHASNSDVNEIALTIVHELCHARLEAIGIQYQEEFRLRIERICVDREIALARKMLSRGLCKEAAVFSLASSRAALDDVQFSDAALKAYQRKELLQKLRLLGKVVPRSFRRVMVLMARRRLKRLRQL